MVSPHNVMSLSIPSTHTQVWQSGGPQVNLDLQVVLAPAERFKSTACVLLQVPSSCCLSEGSTVCCVKTSMETPSVQKSTSPHIVTMRNTRYLPEQEEEPD